MEPPPNPYESPKQVAQPVSLWGWFWRLLQSARPPNFSAGDPTVVEGVAFYIDPGNDSVLYAASPSYDQSERRMNLVVAEAIRVLPIFLAKDPRLSSLLADRKLCVRIIATYDDPSDVHCERILDWDILGAILKDEGKEAEL